MTRGDLFGGAWLVGLLALAVYLAGVSFEAAASLPLTAARVSAAAPAAVRDASGREVVVRDFRRIASASAYADDLLFALAEPQRVAALSDYGFKRARAQFRYGERPLLSTANDVERLLSQHADLLLVNHLGAQSELARVRGAGIAVFDFGEMRGLASLEPNILQLASLLGERARGEQLWRRFSQQLHAIARDVPTGQRKRALYLATYAGKFYGGTTGTSYHDVLEAAGLSDVAAERYRDWPQFDPEELLRLDPPLIVTDTGMGAALCDNVWLRALHACRSRRAGIVELPSSLLGDPGLDMLEAAMTLHDVAYPQPPSPDMLQNAR